MHIIGTWLCVMFCTIHCLILKFKCLLNEIILRYYTYKMQSFEVNITFKMNKLKCFIIFLLIVLALKLRLKISILIIKSEKII